MFKDQKNYKRLVKQQQGKFVAKMFEQLDECQKNDPKKYMDIGKKIRDGTFDRKSKFDSDSISPDVWNTRFYNLLGPKIEKSEQSELYESYVKEKIENNNKFFEKPLQKNEILDAVKN